MGDFAKALLAAEFEASGYPGIADDVRRGPAPGFCTPLWMDEALRAIDKALASRTPSHEVVEALNAYRAAVSFIGADAWDGCSDCMDILRAARSLDTGWDWAGDPNRIAGELKRVRSGSALSLSSTQGEGVNHEAD